MEQKRDSLACFGVLHLQKKIIDTSLEPKGVIKEIFRPIVQFHAWANLHLVSQRRTLFSVYLAWPIREKGLCIYRRNYYFTNFWLLNCV